MTFPRFIASGCGCGYFPAAPGTAGSLIALAIGAGLFALSPWVLAVAALTVSVGGVWAVQASGAKGDPGWIVIDEFAGQWIAMLGLGAMNPVGLLAAFALFRLFDITKPGPIRRAEHLPPIGFGIMADDLVAGVAAAIVARVGVLVATGL